MITRLTKICLVAVLFISICGCEKKSCKNVVCPVGQECYNGACLCTDGYEGTNCSTLSSDKYVGNYYVSETCGTTQPNFASYNVYIFADPNGYVNHIQVSNLFNYGDATFYILNTDATQLGNTIYVPQQTVGGSISVSGTGRFDPYNHRMIIDFNYTFQGGTYSCEHIFYKQ